MAVLSLRCCRFFTKLCNLVEGYVKGQWHEGHGHWPKGGAVAISWMQNFEQVTHALFDLQPWNFYTRMRLLMGCIHTWIVPSVEWSLPQETRPLNRAVRCNYDSCAADGSSRKVTVFRRLRQSYWFVLNPAGWWLSSAEPTNSSSSHDPINHACSRDPAALSCRYGSRRVVPSFSFV